MTPSHALKKGKRYRYYFTHASELRPGEPQAWRMPAADFEALVVHRVTEYLRDHRELASLAGAAPSAAQLRDLLDLCDSLAEKLQAPVERRAVIGRLLLKVIVEENKLILHIDAVQLAGLLKLPPPPEDETLELFASASKVRQGTTTKLVLAGVSQGRPRWNHTLLALLVEAQAARAAVLAAPRKSLRVLAAEQGRCRHRLAKLVRLSFLLPELTAGIIEGRVRHSLTSRRLLDEELSLEWADQALILDAS
jgi:hypothetical protein